MEERVGLQGKFICEIYDKEGNLKEVFEVPNVVTKEGKFYLLKAGVSNETTPYASWYMGLIGANITPSDGDTASSALGTNGSYQEVTSYTATQRPQYVAVGNSANQSISNLDSPASFEASAGFTTYGAFIVSSSVKGSNSGTLLCAGKFNTAKTLANGEIIVVKYTISAS